MFLVVIVIDVCWKSGLEIVFMSLCLPRLAGLSSGSIQTLQTFFSFTDPRCDLETLASLDIYSSLHVTNKNLVYIAYDNIIPTGIKHKKPNNKKGKTSIEQHRSACGCGGRGIPICKKNS